MDIGCQDWMTKIKKKFMNRFDEGGASPANAELTQPTPSAAFDATTRTASCSVPHTPASSALGPPVTTPVIAAPPLVP